MVVEALERVRRRIDEAARRAGRDPAGVRLICVTKGVEPALIEEALAAGVREIGENRVQEAVIKKAQMGPDLKWHMIGCLQRNKAKLAADIFDVIHSADSAELIRALDLHRGALQLGRPLEALVEVNVSGEATKSGCRPEEACALVEEVLRAKNLRWEGLMAMAPYSEDPEAARPHFRALRELRDRLRRELAVSGAMGLHLSMGMSGDFEAAVGEGATMVRIGAAIFGSRL